MPNLTPDDADKARSRRYAALFDELTRLAAREHPLGGPVEHASGRWVESPAWRRLASAGVLRTAASPEFGGLDAPTPELAALCEAAGRADYRGPLLPTLHAMELAGLLADPNDRAELLPSLAAGQLAAALVVDPALDHTPGSDTGKLTGDHLKGTVRFVPWAGTAEQLLVLTTIDDRPALVQVPLPNPEVLIRRQDDLARGELYRIDFSGVPLAGARPMWLAAEADLARVLARARLRLAAYLLGLATGTVEETIDYTNRRKQFGRAVSRFQTVSFRLADLVTQVHGVRLVCGQLASLADGAAPLTQRAAQVLAKAARLARTAGVEAMQLHGAIGLTEDSPAQRFYRHSTVDGLGLGTPEALYRLAGARLAAAPAEAPRFACEVSA
ncbi:MAG TPA: acyl-CoA dehydrogenase family protein [Pseudonocardiaceae bacterium]|jgi:alkylation response protein AidB-like acyl-CoA dehydrogenase